MENNTAVNHEQQPGKRKRWRFFPILLTGCAIILFAGLILFAHNHRSVSGTGQLPVITADQTPVKIKPDEPGGMDIPFKDTTVYDELAQGKQKKPAGHVEHLLQPPEQPMPKPEATTPTPAAEVQKADAPAIADPAAADDETPSSTPPADNTPPGTAATNKLLPPPAAKQPTKLVAHAIVSPLAEVQKAAIPASGVFTVQLGAFKDEATANSEWQRLGTAHPQQLGSLTPIIEQADLGAKGTWYRLKGGPLDEATAKQVCETLKASNVACIVAHK